MIGKVISVFDSNEKQIKSTDKELKKIKENVSRYEEKSFDDFKNRINEIKAELKILVDKVPFDAKLSVKKIDRTKGLPDFEKDVMTKLIEVMPEVYAMLDIAYKRKYGIRFHDVQFRAGILLARGQRLVEQYTGEGKTMTFQLPLVLYSLAGRGSHLVTVNDYLTKVGAEYAGHVMSELGLTVGVNTANGVYKFIPDDQLEAIKGQEILEERKAQKQSIDAMTGINLSECTKKEAYSCDITYSTNNELGFDYLRDNMAWDLSRIVQRELYFCIIDEADSILIDEARTPLIISAAPSESDTEKYRKFADAVRGLEENTHFIVNHKDRAASLTEEGIRIVEENLGIGNLWANYSAAYHIENALKAKALFNRDDQYIVRGGEVLIVDEFTGRILKGRRYSEGLHQAIEAKEGVDIKEESKTYATITFQNLFRLYKVLAGGSGTVLTEGEEFYKIYGLETVVIPTNKPNVRRDFGDRIYKTSDAKFKAVASEIEEKYKIGQPVLIGTTSVENSEYLSQLLDEKGIPHEVLNAKFHEQESRIVANAGKKYAVTVATNMAGRGTDIVIGGGIRGDSSWKEVADLGGLHVIGTERHDARRIDNQLRGRTGRQGEPGSTRFYVSLDDKIMRVLGGEIIARLMSIIKVSDDMPIEHKLISKQIEIAQKRVESVNFDSRKNVVDYDDVMNQHREIFYARRKNTLIRGENALGKFLEAGRVINTNNNEAKKEEYKTKIEEAKLLLEDSIKNIVNDEIDFFVNSTLMQMDVSEASRAILDFIPDIVLMKVTDKNSIDLENYLRDLVENKNKYELEDLFNKCFLEKLKEFDNDSANLFKMISLEELDKGWVEHLELMKDIRDGIGLQGYAQRDPLVEYKNKAYEMFESLINTVNSEIARKLFRMVKSTSVQRTGTTNVQLQTNQDQVEDVLEGDREILSESNLEKISNIMDSITSNRAKLQNNFKTNSTETSSQQKHATKTFGRNDKVSVRYKDGRELKDVKFKKVQEDIESGECEVIN